MSNLESSNPRKITIPVRPNHPELGETKALVLVDKDQVNNLIGGFSAFTKGFTEAFNNGKPWVLVPILTGGIYFGTELSKMLGQQGIDHCFEPIKYKSYKGQTKQASEVSSFDFEAYHDFNVILIDELYDTGNTMTELHNLFKEKLSKDSVIQVFVLFRKILRNKPEGQVEPTYVGLHVPDLWYIGCGLDHFGTKRELPFLAAVPKDSEDKKIPEDEIFNDDDYFSRIRYKIRNGEYMK